MMKNLYLFAFTLIFMYSLNTVPGYSQGNNHCAYVHPDSLNELEVSGTAIVDATTPHVQYFIDTDGDDAADYRLNFGPWWYEPDSGSAVRPENGANITVSGGAHDCAFSTFSVIVVYEINGEYWRTPYLPQWNNMGHQMHFGGHHEGCIQSAFGFMHEPVHPDTLNGVVLIDSLFFYPHYYLDTDADETPDYFLNFGPWWYTPESGATRPEDGEQVTVVGGVVDRPVGPMMIVFLLDDLEWRTPQNSGPHFGGHWIHRNMSQDRRIHSPFDDEDWMEVQPGWHHGMGGGHHGGMPDSLFCQILEVFPQNIPNTGDMHVFAGYEMGMFGPGGQNGMWGDGGCGGHMTFQNNIQFGLHFNDIQLQAYQIDESSVEVLYWDNHSEEWIKIQDAEIDSEFNSIRFSMSDVSNFIILRGEESPTALGEPDRLITEGFLLKQNYPNPTTGETHFVFVLEHDAEVSLTLHNSMGRQIEEVFRGRLPEGEHEITYHTQSVSPGIYFYRLRTGGKSQVRSMQIAD